MELPALLKRKKMNAANEIKSERLILRAVQSSDLKALFRYRSDSETNKYQGWIPTTTQEVEEFLGNVATEINLPNTWFQYVIIDTQTMNIVGDVGIHFLDEYQSEIGCTLEKNKQGLGFATEALTAVIEYLFTNLSKHRIIGSIDPCNSKSIRLLERLGFRKEAHLKESILINGKWKDDIIFAILKKEWNPSRFEKCTFN